MFFLTFCLILAVALVAFAILANQVRTRDTWDFELKPNCLLTRWPILFVTGPRSLFYFSKYWNHYSSFLAEHGYEVFTLHLPWNKSPERRARMQEFFAARSAEGRHFHLIVDSFTMEELKLILSSESYSCLVSVSELCDADRGPQLSLKAMRIPWSPVEFYAKDRGAWISRLAYLGHKKLIGKKRNLLSLAGLGGCPSSREENAILLLERAQVLAEMDLGTP